MKIVICCSVVKVGLKKCFVGCYRLSSRLLRKFRLLFSRSLLSVCFRLLNRVFGRLLLSVLF